MLPALAFHLELHSFLLAENSNVSGAKIAFASDYHIDTHGSAYGFIAAAMAAGATLSCPFAGFLQDRFGRWGFHAPMVLLPTHNSLTMKNTKACHTHHRVRVLHRSRDHDCYGTRLLADGGWACPDGNGQCVVVECVVSWGRETHASG